MTCLYCSINQTVSEMCPECQKEDSDEELVAVESVSGGDRIQRHGFGWRTVQLVKRKAGGDAFEIVYTDGTCARHRKGTMVTRIKGTS